MPVGYLISVSILAAGMLLALLPNQPQGRLGPLCFLLTMVLTEAPVLGVYYLLVNTALAFLQAGVSSTTVLMIFALGSLPFIGTPVLVRRSRYAEQVMTDALATAFGTAALARHFPVSSDRRSSLRLLLTPLPLAGRGVERQRNLTYGPAGRRNRLDVFTAPSGAAPSGRPVLIHLHGGGFRIGTKSLFARDLLQTFARRGWVTISANYRLRPATFRDVVIDTKHAIAWARRNAAAYGGDPDRIVVVGSSAGAHLAMTAALTSNDPRFQPGFETDDTSVRAAVGLYGYYGRIDSGPMASSPVDYLTEDAPPVLVVHGAQDTLVRPELARAFVEQLRTVSTDSVGYAELPGAQHGFDLWRSVRFAAVIDAIDMFAACVFDGAQHR